VINIGKALTKREEFVWRTGDLWMSLNKKINTSEWIEISDFSESTMLGSNFTLEFIYINNL
jgi:hypothetical protein